MVSSSSSFSEAQASLCVAPRSAFTPPSTHALSFEMPGVRQGYPHPAGRSAGSLVVSS